MEVTVVGSLGALSSVRALVCEMQLPSHLQNFPPNAKWGRTLSDSLGSHAYLLVFFLSSPTILFFMMSKIFKTSVSEQSLKITFSIRSKSTKWILPISDPDPAHCCIIVDHSVFFMFVRLIKHPLYGIKRRNPFQAMGCVYFPCSTACIVLVRRSFDLNSVGVCSPDTTRKSNALVAPKLFLLLFFPPSSPLLFLFQTL